MAFNSRKSLTAATFGRRGKVVVDASATLNINGEPVSVLSRKDCRTYLEIEPTDKGHSR